MHSRAATGPQPWRWAAFGLLLVLAGWLIPNPLPWRSPLQGGGGPARTGAPAASLAVGGGVAGRTQLSTSAPPPEPAPRRVPTRFHGTWRGNGVNFLGSPPFTVVVTFPAKSSGSTAATADFPTLGCREVWRLEQSTPTVLTLQATLAGGPCLARPLRVQAELTDRSHLFVQWRLLNSVVESQAQLAR